MTAMRRIPVRLTFTILLIVLWATALIWATIAGAVGWEMFLGGTMFGWGLGNLDAAFDRNPSSGDRDVSPNQMALTRPDPS